MFADKRLFEVFYNYDLQRGRISILKEVLEFTSKDNRVWSILLIEQLLVTVLSFHPEKSLLGGDVAELDTASNLISVFNTEDKKVFESLRSAESPADNARFIYKH